MLTNFRTGKPHGRYLEDMDKDGKTLLTDTYVGEIR